MVRNTLLGGLVGFALSMSPISASALILPPVCALADDVEIYSVRSMSDGTALLSGQQRNDGIVYLLFPSNSTMIAVRSIDDASTGHIRTAITDMIASAETFTVQNILDRFSGGNLRSWTAEMSAELSNCLQEAS